ncbi:MAG TPA: hypothetical protein VFK27_05735, partial [Bacillales bacterium]|nr:hypothetical protein [Bacillales bacterium]
DTKKEYEIAHMRADLAHYRTAIEELSMNHPGDPRFEQLLDLMQPLDKALNDNFGGDFGSDAFTTGNLSEVESEKSEGGEASAIRKLEPRGLPPRSLTRNRRRFFQKR